MVDYNVWEHSDKREILSFLIIAAIGFVTSGSIQLLLTIFHIVDLFLIYIEISY